MACLELCEGFYTTQRQIPTQIPIGFCTHFIGLCQCKHSITALQNHSVHSRPTKVLSSTVNKVERVIQAMNSVDNLIRSRTYTRFMYFYKVQLPYLKAPPECLCKKPRYNNLHLIVHCQCFTLA